jgi:hypothetical protein
MWTWEARFRRTPIAPSALLSADGHGSYTSPSRSFSRGSSIRRTALSCLEPKGQKGPFFSPDGQGVAFNANGKLKKISVRGGPVIQLCDVPWQGGSWGEDGNIITRLNFTLSRVPAAGGAPTPLTELAPGEIAHRWPQILPGGKAVIFTAYPSITGVEGATIQALSLRDGRRKTLLRGGTFGRYLSSGHLAYIDRGTLFAVPFDADHLEVHGKPKPVLPEVEYSTAWGFGQ